MAIQSDAAPPVPLYYRLAAALRADIESGRWRPGEQIPTEAELGHSHGVSRTVVRQAVGELVSVGLLRRAQGRGTFVAAPRLRQGPHRLLSFTTDMLGRGLRPGSRLLSAALVPAGEEVAAALQTSAADPVWKVVRLRQANGEPMGIQTAYLPARVCPELPLERLTEGSLYALLRERYGLAPAWAVETYIAVSLSGEEARLLQVEEGSPGLAVERVTRDGAGRIFEYVRSLMRGDRYQITLELEAED